MDGEGLDHAHRSQRIDAQRLLPRAVVGFAETLVLAAVDSSVVEQNVERFDVEGFGERGNSGGVSDVEPMHRDIGGGRGGDGVERAGGVRIAAAAVDSPARCGILLGEGKAQPAVGSGNQDRRHVHSPVASAVTGGAGTARGRPGQKPSAMSCSVSGRSMMMRWASATEMGPDILRRLSVRLTVSTVSPR